jgi:hypothetical protein
MIRLCHLGEIDDLFTDLPPPEGLTDVISASGCRVHIAGDES